MTYESLDSIVRRWLDGNIDTSERTLRIGHNYIDAQKLSGQFLGTAAIHFNRVVLLNSLLKFPAENMAQVIADTAEAAGYETIAVPAKQMTDLRASMSAASSHARMYAKRFRQNLRAHKALFPALDHPRQIVNDARAINAFQHYGEMTHFICRLGEPDTIVAWFRSDELAVEAFMRIKDTSQLQILEIGG